MFRIICGNGPGLFTAAEHASVQQLVDSCGALVTASGVADVRSEGGFTACAVFLANVDRAAQALGLQAAPRCYRSKFSANYRALFPDGNRHYRVDVLEASVDQQFAIFVNGVKFELSADAVVACQALATAWTELIATLNRWRRAEAEREHIAGALVAFDVAWAAFERLYIGELIAIEEQARQLVVEAVRCESRLPAELVRFSIPGAEQAEREFVRCIAGLNSVANFKRKGRDDLGVEILARSRAILRSGTVEGPNFSSPAGREAARVLAGDVLASYEAMRNYFKKVGTRIEHVDPHLCNNVGLVARLVDYEESWEVGARYICQPHLLDAVCDVVAEVRAAERLAPEFTAMCEDCDVELFLVLPRLVILAFLSDPTGARKHLIQSVLPHRFAPDDDEGAQQRMPKPAKVDHDLKLLHDQFKECMRVLAKALPPRTSAPTVPASPLGGRARSPQRAAAWELLVRQAIQGAEDDSLETYAPEAHKVTRELMRAVERWSLELQRHCPEDWNQCSSVIVHCMIGGATKAREPSWAKFQV